MERPSLLVRLGVLAGLSIATLGATDSASHYYRTYVNETYGSPFGMAGQLVLRFDAAHHIGGVWRPESGPAQTLTVSGELRGLCAVFDIGTDLHVTARIANDGSIRGTAVSDRSNQPLSFAATPEASPE